MARGLLVLAALAVLLPAVAAQTGLGAGGLAPSTAPGPAASTANISVPTDLCDAEFCLQAAPAACGGNCILTPVGNTTSYCATACIAVWNSASVQSCLTGQATGVYVQQQLTTIANVCNAGTLAAQRRATALKKYNALFPCTVTEKVNSTILLGLDSCSTGANATATNCAPQCQSSLQAIPASCTDTFPTLSSPWNATLTSCLASAASPSAGIGGNSSGLALSPSASAPAPQAALHAASPSAIAAALLAAFAAALLA